MMIEKRKIDICKENTVSIGYRYPSNTNSNTIKESKSIKAKKELWEQDEEFPDWLRDNGL